MSRPALEPPTPPRVRRVDLPGWQDWLTENLSPRWRESEWDPATWFFTGDPDNQRTVAFWCPVIHCSSIANNTGLCSPCIRDFAASGMTRAEFVERHVPENRKASPGRFVKQCIVSRDGLQCVTTAYCQGLCQPHYNSWRTTARRNPGLTIDGWLSKTTRVQPRLTVRPACVVIRCGQEQYAGQTLCPYHWAKHKREASNTSPAIWARKQTPFLYAHQFSLLRLKPVVRLEILHMLQQRDARGAKVDPTVIRALVLACEGLEHVIGRSSDELMDRFVTTGQSPHGNARAHVNELIRWTTVGFERMTGVEPTEKLVWDLLALDLRADERARRVRVTPGVADFTRISQPWLQTLAMAYCRTHRTSREVLDTIRAAEVASRALQRTKGGGRDATRLGLADMDLIVKEFREWRDEDGALFAHNTRKSHFAELTSLFEFGRRANLMQDIPNGFNRERTHTLPREESQDDEAGRALPEFVITQLDQVLDDLDSAVDYRYLSAAEQKLMMRTAYIVLRDTGRRPREVCSLSLDCLGEDDGPILIWDNRKGRRLKRRLPISRETAQHIATWQQMRRSLNVPAQSAAYLFPARDEDAVDPHFAPAHLSQSIRDWVNEMADLHSTVSDADGNPQPFDRTRVYPYAFRHSYAQRHADAGTPIDVLRELMDHKQIATTQVYYRVSLKRKRAAVKTMRLQVVDKSGTPTPVESDVAYSLRSVAVPFGNCAEPSNVKAGGKACPIRFQCAGCGFYRPDPSFLPAIEDQIRNLRADRETALAFGADDFVVRNLDDQIHSFQQVVESIHDQLARLPATERAEIEDASAILRKTRAATGMKLLPISPAEKPTRTTQ